MLEQDEISAIDFSPEILAIFFGYALTLLCFYGLMSVFLQRTESLFFNLSLLSTDIYIVLASYAFFHEPVSSYYWIALVFNLIGIGIYSIDAPNPGSGLFPSDEGFDGDNFGIVSDELDFDPGCIQPRFRMVSTPPANLDDDDADPSPEARGSLTSSEIDSKSLLLLSGLTSSIKIHKYHERLSDSMLH